jgi:restriction system protein
VIRAGEGGDYFEDFEKDNYVAIGWEALGDLSEIKNVEQLRQLMDKTYPEWKPRKRAVSISMVGHFLFDIKKGSPVISYDTDTRKYIIGEIVGDYEFRGGLNLPQVRKVVWKGKVDRDLLSVPTRNTLGAIQTLFTLNLEAWDEISKVLKGAAPTESESPEQTEEEVDSLRLEAVSKAHEFIKDIVLNLDWEEMQELVAGILRAMGYKTTISNKGGDRGKDILASPDGLGLEQPRILVEVKHRQGSMGTGEVRSFIGGLRDNDKGLYVSTGGFSKEARYEAERATIPVTLLDSDALVNLLVQYYDTTDTETRALVPLKRIYWPAE